MTILRTFLNYQEEAHTGEINTLPSETQPDMTMSLEELLRRHTRGLEIPTFDPQYSEDYIPDNVQDITDYDDFREQNQNYINHLKTPKPAEGGKPQTSDGQLADSDGDPEPTPTP